MSYRLVDSNDLAIKYPEVNNMPCIYADLPNGLDCAYYSVNRLAEPKPGTWIKMSDADGVYFACSECGEALPRIKHFDPQFDLFPRLESIDRTNYCPNCGVKMKRNNVLLSRSITQNRQRQRRGIISPKNVYVCPKETCATYVLVVKSKDTNGVKFCPNCGKRMVLKNGN